MFLSERFFIARRQELSEGSREMFIPEDIERCTEDRTDRIYTEDRTYRR
jgi:hypothetical protein